MIQTRSIELLAQHQRLARRAHERGMISIEQLCEALLLIGQMIQSDSGGDMSVWVDLGWLDAATLAQLTDELEHDTLDPPTTPLFHELSEPSYVQDSIHETIMTVHTAVIQRQNPDFLDRLKTTQHTPVSGLRAVHQTGEGLTVKGLVRRPERVPDPFHDRYEVGESLGQGGGGRVLRAYDRVLGRHVAMKILRSGGSENVNLLQRFVLEAQTTGRLEHPNIVPIYDFGTLPDGDAFYTMREVRKHSLREVLQELKRGSSWAEEEYNLIRMIMIVQQVCQALHYAHVRGVVHRDIKPDNIMLGDYGEVLVMDWGLARATDLQATPSKPLDELGQTLGTPAYMSPEQARGELGLVDQLSDVYSLGALLYEILTLEPPYRGSSPLDIMWSVVDGQLQPPRERAPERDIPEELEAICLRAMAHGRQARFQSAKQLHDALAEWIEGIQPREANERALEGHALMQHYMMLRHKISALDLRVKAQAAKIQDWAPIIQKRALWSIEDDRAQATLESAQVFGQAVSHFTQALAYQPNHEEAKRGLATLYWSRFEQAEAENDVTNALYFKALTARYDEANIYQDLLRDEVSVSICCDRPQANISLCALVERDRRLVLGPAQSLGPAPVLCDGLFTGSYIITLSALGSIEQRYPLFLERGKDLLLDLSLPSASLYREGFAFIPGGEFICGGDPQAFDPRPASRVFVEDFFLSVYPVTFREYLEWLNELFITNPDEALQRAPHLRSSDGMLVRFDEVIQRWVPDEILIEGAARDLYPTGQGHEWDIPVVGVNYDDAQAYIRWRAARDGVPYRLPREHELEKAGRGVDGRIFPWGNRFDATFCKMRFSRASSSQLEPIGIFEADRSVYGVCDLAGGVQEWCHFEGDPRQGAPIKGGGWNQDRRSCHLASRIRVLPQARTSSTGFRLAYDIFPTD